MSRLPLWLWPCQVCSRLDSEQLSRTAADAVLLVMLNIYGNVGMSKRIGRYVRNKVAVQWLGWLYAFEQQHLLSFSFRWVVSLSLSLLSFTHFLFLFVSARDPLGFSNLPLSLIALQRFYSNRIPKCFLSYTVNSFVPEASLVTVDQKRSQHRCPFSCALRDMFQLEDSNHSSCPFTWHQFWMEPKVWPLGHWIVCMCWPFVRIDCIANTKHIKQRLFSFFLALRIVPLIYHD